METKVNAIFPLLQRLGNGLLPHHCLLCGVRADARLCQGCREALPWNRQACARCALPLPAAHAERLCGRCLRQPPAVVRSWAALTYRAPVAPLINHFKHRHDLTSGQLLADLLADFLREQQALTDADALIPVPLHWRRRWRRTFNQSAFLAQQLSRALDLPWLDPIRRIEPTPRQQALGRQQRLRNLRGAFQLSQPQQVTGKHLVLVDDVMTTGATAQALASLLNKAGAKRVDFCCIARTPEPGKATSPRSDKSPMA